MERSHSVKNRVLFVVFAGVFAVCAAVFGYAAWKILKRPRVGSGVAGRVSRDAVLVANIDLRQVRGWQPAITLQERLSRPGDGASEMQREVARRYTEFRQNCGFDPWQKVDTMTMGVERSVLAATDASSVVTFLDGTYAQADAERCIRWIAREANRTIATSTVAGRTVLTPSRQSDNASEHPPQFTLLPGSTMVTDDRYTARALGVLDGNTPSLGAAAPLTQMMSRLGATTFVSIAADLAEFRARQAHTIDGYIDEIVRQNPNAPDLALLRQARIGGLGLAVDNNALAVSVRVEEPSAGDAQRLTTACTTVLQARRPQLLEALQNAKQSQGMMRITLGVLGNMAERFDRIDAAFNAAEQVVNQLACRGAAQDAMLAVSITQPQLTSLQNGVTAFGEIMAEASRLNPLGGLLGGGGLGGAGGGFGGAPGGPLLDRGAPEQPGSGSTAPTPPVPTL